MTHRLALPRFALGVEWPQIIFVDRHPGRAVEYIFPQGFDEKPQEWIVQAGEIDEQFRIQIDNRVHGRLACQINCFAVTILSGDGGQVG